jgi:hypothetical protein
MQLGFWNSVYKLREFIHRGHQQDAVPGRCTEWRKPAERSIPRYE